MDVGAFLASHPPFDAMERARVDRLAHDAERKRAHPGALILSVEGPPADAVFVVLDGQVEFRRGEEVFDFLGPGEVFGFPSLLSGDRPMFDVWARTEVSYLHIPRAAAEAVFEEPAGLRFLASGLRERAELLAMGSEDPTGLAAGAARADSYADLVRVGREIPDSVAKIRSLGLGASAIGRALAGVIDRITARTLDLAIAESGEPGAPWAWLAFGSVARREPGLTPDQDHTVVWEGPDDLDPAFSRVAVRVVDVLSRAGLPPCPSGVLATTQGWRGPADRWISHVLTPVPSEVREAFRSTIALDLRRVSGPLDTSELRRRLREGVRADGRLGWHVTRLALEIRPPTGHLGGIATQRLPDGRRVVDVKSGGLLPVTDLARLLDLRGGGGATGTRERLRRAASRGAIGQGSAEALEAAFETFQEVRLDHELQLVGEGRPVDHLVDPSELEPVTRGRLRQAFRIVADIQEGFRAELGGSRLA